MRVLFVTAAVLVLITVLTSAIVALANSSHQTVGVGPHLAAWSTGPDPQLGNGPTPVPCDPDRVWRCRILKAGRTWIAVAVECGLPVRRCDLPDSSTEPRPARLGKFGCGRCLTSA